MAQMVDSQTVATQDDNMLKVVFDDVTASTDDVWKTTAFAILDSVLDIHNATQSTKVLHAMHK